MIYNYNDIINEWFALLPKGYAIAPYNAEEMQILKEVLKKRGFPATETFFKPDYIMEKVATPDDIDGDGKLDDMGDRVRIEAIEFMHAPDKFIEFIYANYVEPGEEVRNLENLYIAIRQLPKDLYTGVVKLIAGSSKRNLAYGTYKMGKFELILLQLIEKYVRLKIGHQLQLWFSILHEGKIAAAVRNSDDGVNADVVKPNEIGIAIQKFDTARVIDFGLLPSELIKQMKGLVALFSILTNTDVSLTRQGINDLFVRINDPAVTQEMQQLISTSQDTKIQSIARMGGKLSEILKGAPVTSFIGSFCATIDEQVFKKLSEVDFWGCIDGMEVIIQSSQDVYNKLKTQDNKIPDSIIGFDNYHLWVDAELLYKKEIERQEYV